MNNNSYFYDNTNLKDIHRKKPMIRLDQIQNMQFHVFNLVDSYIEKTCFT